MLLNRLSYCLSVLTFVCLVGETSTLSAQELASKEEEVPGNAVGVIRQYSPKSTEMDSSPILRKIKDNANPDDFLTVIFLAGLPKNKELLCSCKRPLMVNINESIKTVNRNDRLARLQLVDEGPTWTTKTTDDGETLCIFQAEGFFPGEEVKLKITSENGEVYYVKTLIPQPIHVESPSKKMSVDVKLKGMMGCSRYHIRLSGVSNNERLIFRTISGNEKQEVSFIFSDEQKDIWYLPDVVGRLGGLAKVSFEDSSSEKIEFTLPWGIDLWKYIKGGMIYSPDGPKKCSCSSQ